MKILTTNDMRVLGFKLVKGVLLCAALVAGVSAVFSLGSYAGEIFGKLLSFLE